MYANDYDESLPYYQRPWGGTWYDDLQPYMKNRRITVCPSKPEWNENDATHQVGYGLNEVVLPAGPPYGVFIPAPTALAQIDYPAETIGGADKDQGNVRCIGPSFAGSTTWPYNVGTRHNEGANSFCLDGHSKWMAKGGPWSKSNEMWDLN